MISQQREDIQGNEIQNEYIRIDGHWLLLHYKISVGLVLFAFFVECVISTIVINSDLMNTTLPIYIAKFIAIPSGINFICIMIDTMILKLKCITQKQKIYIISLLFSIICCVLFTAHNAFVATFYIFSVSIMLTVVYANYRITLCTSMVSLILLILSEVFISWDIDKESIFQSTIRMSDFLIAVFILTAFTMICMVVIKYEQRKNLVSIKIEQERKSLEQRIRMDELTGLYNRKVLYDMLKNIDDTKDGKYILTIIDIDKFKEINDNFGHQIGDTCLINFARLLNENGFGAIPFRYAGDEFCLLFYNIELGEAKKVCEQIRLKTKELGVDEGFSVTASFGIAEYNKMSGAAQLFARADQALYKAKKLRDSIEIYER